MFVNLKDLGLAEEVRMVDNGLPNYNLVYENLRLFLDNSFDQITIAVATMTFILLI